MAKETETRDRKRARNLAPLFLTPPELAEQLNISRGALCKMVNEGRVPAPIRMSKTMVRYPYHHIQRWMEMGCPPDYDALVNRQTRKLRTA